jgi:hypothetical protein
MTITEYFDMIQDINSTLNRYDFRALTVCFFSIEKSMVHDTKTVLTVDGFHNELYAFVQENIPYWNIESFSKTLVFEEVTCMNENEKQYVAIATLPSKEQVNIFLTVHLTKL